MPAALEFTVPAPRVENTGELVNVCVLPNLFESVRSVEDAAVTVPEAPSTIGVPFIVIEEFCNAELGKFKVELAAVKGTPPLLVTTNPLLPIPQFVVVLKAVVIFTAPVAAETIMGYVAVSKVTPPDPVPQSEPVPESTPELFTWRHCVDPVMPENVTLFAAVNPPLNVIIVDVAFDENG